MGLTEQLDQLSQSLAFVVPELLLAAGIASVIVAGLVARKTPFTPAIALALLSCSASLLHGLLAAQTANSLFLGLLSVNGYSRFFGALADLGALLALLMTRRRSVQRPAEYAVLILTITLGAHLLVMSSNFVMLLLSLELISIMSYALAGWAFSRSGSEGSMKYFLFGSIATAIMLYGMSLLYGMTGSFDLSSREFSEGLINSPPALILAAGMMTLAGFLFKIAAVPMHWWAPDVYQASPTPVVAFFSVVPKLAGLGALMKVILAVNVFGRSAIDWQLVLATIAVLSIAAGNFSALWQQHPKRLLAYSSIAQSGFLLVGATAMSLNGMHAMLFYAVVLLLMNFLTFLGIQSFEQMGVIQLEDFAGRGREGSWSSMALTAGLVSLVGLPVTAGFTAKLFVFSGLWSAYGATQKPFLLVLFVFGLLNGVVALFYYLKVPYYLFIKSRNPGGPPETKTPVVENLLSVVLVISILALFFRPDILMGWIIRIKFVL